MTPIRRQISLPAIQDEPVSLRSASVFRGEPDSLPAIVTGDQWHRPGANQLRDADTT